METLNKFKRQSLTALFLNGHQSMFEGYGVIPNELCFGIRSFLFITFFSL